MPEVRLTCTEVPEHVRAMTGRQLSVVVSRSGKCRAFPSALAEEFFPLTRPGVDQPDKRREAEQKARRLCGGCPVQAECLESALRFPGEQHGVFGATTEWEREEILRERRREVRVGQPAVMTG
ncbi:MAG: Transcription factor WhiB [Micromonosporaceae bacterium]